MCFIGDRYEGCFTVVVRRHVGKRYSRCCGRVLVEVIESETTRTIARLYRGIGTQVRHPTIPNTSSLQYYHYDLDRVSCKRADSDSKVTLKATKPRELVYTKKK